jgi:hypothetical protein
MNVLDDLKVEKQLHLLHLHGLLQLGQVLQLLLYTSSYNLWPRTVISPDTIEQHQGGRMKKASFKAVFNI